MCNTMQAKLNLDVSEMTQQIQLIESKFLELTTRLHLKDVEIADLERTQKVQYSRCHHAPEILHFNQIKV